MRPSVPCPSCQTIHALLAQPRLFFAAQVSRVLKILPALFLCALFSAQLRAQDTTTDDEVVRVRTDLVTVPAFVTDARGRRVSNLSQSDFEILSDKPTARIEYFAVGTEHVALCFALDASGSVREIITRQRETALALFKHFGPASRVAVLRFGEHPSLILPFTSDEANALRAFQFPALPNQHTAIFDAAAAAIRSFNARTSDHAERRIVILISDGLDNASATSAAAVIDEARQSNVSIYVIHLPLFAPRDGRLEPRPASKGFRDLAEKTGGRYFMVGDARSSLDPNSQANLAPVFVAIEEDLRGQYVLGFYPSDAERDGRFHSIEVGLNSSQKRKLRVQTLRDGYTLK